MGTPNQTPPVSRLDDLFGHKRLPVPLPPFADELFSSWFVRLARANGLRVSHLARNLTGFGRQLFLGDPDRGVWKEPGIELAKLLDLDFKVVEQTYLSAYEGYLWELRPDHGIWRNILPIANADRSNLYPGLLFCPQCLKDDVTPYFRKHWRLAFVTICDLHQCALLDRCPHCNEPVILYKLDVNIKRIDQAPKLSDCSSCGESLCATTSKAIESDQLVEFQKLLLTTLERGWVSIGKRSVHSVLFFEGLRMLVSFLDDERFSAKVWAELCSASPPSTHRTARYGGYEAESIERRFGLLEMAAQLLNEWPTGIEIFQRAEVSSNHILRFCKGSPKLTPFWLWEPIHHSLNKTMYVPTDEEILSTARYLFSQKQFTRIRDICSGLNMATTSSLRVAKVWRTFQQERLAFTLPLHNAISQSVLLKRVL